MTSYWKLSLAQAKLVGVSQHIRVSPPPPLSVPAMESHEHFPPPLPLLPDHDEESVNIINSITREGKYNISASGSTNNPSGNGDVSLPASNRRGSFRAALEHPTPQTYDRTEFPSPPFLHQDESYLEGAVSNNLLLKLMLRMFCSLSQHVETIDTYFDHCLRGEADMLRDEIGRRLEEPLYRLDQLHEKIQHLEARLLLLEAEQQV